LWGGVSHVQDDNLASRIVDGVEDQERIAYDGQHPDACFISEVSHKRKFFKQRRQPFDPLYDSNGGRPVNSINIEKMSSTSARAVSDQRTFMHDSD
jgi:hypothetical protein